MKIFLLIILFLKLHWVVFCAEVESPIQNKPSVRINSQLDFVSNHVWRGGKSGTTPAIEPFVELVFENFTIGSWAAATFDGKYKELDVYAIFSFHDFSVGLYDFYCPPEKPKEAIYTNFHGKDTYHLYSIDLVYNGTKKFPVRISASTMLNGMDFNQTTGNYNYSTYLEAVYSKNWKNNILSALLGLTTHKGIYADRLALMNSELMYKKNFAIRKFTIPVFARVGYNPYSSKMWLIGGISLNRLFEF